MHSDSVCNIYRYVAAADSHTCIRRSPPQVCSWANPKLHRNCKQSTKDIYSPVTEYNAVMKPLLCANKHSCHILIIHEILTMLIYDLKKNLNIMKRITMRRETGNYKIFFKKLGA